MKNAGILPIALAACISITACQTSPSSSATKEDSAKSNPAAAPAKGTEIPFVEAKHYFVKNTITSIPSPKITSQDDFNKFFGAAATMGSNGKPTAIDFSKQYVIALMHPVTDSATSITPVSLQKNGNNEMVLTYKVEKGAKQSYAFTPSLILVVDKSHEGNIILKEQ